MFGGFARVRVETVGASIDAVRRGEELPVLLLLRGSPQTPAMWHSSPLDSPKQTDVSPK